MNCEKCGEKVLTNPDSGYNEHFCLCPEDSYYFSERDGEKVYRVVAESPKEAAEKIKDQIPKSEVTIDEILRDLVKD